MPKDSFKSETIDNTEDVQILPPSFVSFPAIEPPTTLQNIIKDWQLIKHREGGYFKETDRSPFTLSLTDGDTPMERNYSTLIYYLLTPDSPVGKFHKNKNRIIHILQRGKGQYVLIYPNGKIKSFKVGFDYANGEISQWVVPGGVYKASFLIPNEEFDNSILISEVVVPGFEYEDHLFMSGLEELDKLVGEKKAEELKFLL
ncbi:hypothetical protein KAFR_0B06720 [Kazachstania africana CBS 2517]|uniref:DUF985 domain-containing protein n=1 Tax=Kazachstania africana (strain ATCC 22294 / BCRC 22015 / CBS 2517 / CECT 1963 / NBRC 1671 / NRRL Y-8276) TaxID=1071382 RepID=H2ARG9_KAZAF|nr:hypothetical protein KAFR_0B06720 [Kazachstania africana CBS 2517]CCF56969.1 hypothetical protein KAFR_0B06720 [Kazachstania africana CBS 2517]